MARMIVGRDSLRLRWSAHADRQWLVCGSPALAGASGRRGSLIQDSMTCYSLAVVDRKDKS